MNSLEKTMSMLESMPEEARERVLLYVQQLFTSYRPANPYEKKTSEAILRDLEESRRQISDGHGQSLMTALSEMGKQHGFI